MIHKSGHIADDQRRLMIMFWSHVWHISAFISWSFSKKAEGKPVILGRGTRNWLLSIVLLLLEIILAHFRVPFDPMALLLIIGSGTGKDSDWRSPRCHLWMREEVMTWRPLKIYSSKKGDPVAELWVEECVCRGIPLEYLLPCKCWVLSTLQSWHILTSGILNASRSVCTILFHPSLWHLHVGKCGCAL